MEIYDLLTGVLDAAVFCGVFYSGWLAYGSPDERRARPSWFDAVMVIGLVGLVYALTSIGYDKIRWEASTLVIVAFNLGRWRGARDVEAREPSGELLVEATNIRR